MGIAVSLVAVGFSCEVVDLDGPLLQAEDWENPIRYDRTGLMSWPSPKPWG